MVALFLVFLLFGGLVADACRVLNANAHASDAAAKAARYGAQEIDPASIRSGVYQLRPAAAESAALDYLDRHGLDGRVTAAAQQVTVTVTWPIRFRFLSALTPNATVTQTRTAAPTTG